MNNRMKLSITMIHFILLFFLASSSFSQHYPFPTITLKDGLPQACIYQTLQDKQGYLWMGTEAGVCRYDGYEFINYSYESGLLSNYVRDIELDAKGRLWLGLFDCGAAVFDGKSFHSLDFAKTIGYSYVIDLEFAPNGDLWIADRDSGIIRITNQAKPQVKLFKQRNIAHPGFKVMRLSNGDMLGFTPLGISRFIESNNYEPIHYNVGSLYSGFEEPDGGIWLAGTGKLWFWKDDSMYNYSHLVHPKQLILDIVRPKGNDEMYMATNMGLLIVHQNSSITLGTRNGLSYDLVRSLFQDRFGNVWANTYGNGATIVTKHTMKHYDSDGRGNDFCTFAMVEDANGDMILGRYADGYYVCNDTSLTKLNIGIPDGANPYVSVKDSLNNLYLLAHNNNIYKVKDKKLVASYHFDIDPTTYCISLMDNNDILLCTDAGLYIFNETTKKITHLKSVPDIYWSSVCRDETGAFWVAGDRGEVLRYHNNSISDFTNEINPSLSGINQILYDKKHGLYWFCSDAGLIIWNQKEKLTITTANGILSNVFYSITQDQEGRIWAGHIKGIECINVEKKEIDHIGYSDGFLPMETNVNAALTDSKGYVWFGTITSASKIDAKNFGKDSTSGILRLQEIHVNKELKFKENYNDSVYPKLKLTHSQNNISFKVASICFSNATAVKYMWMLEGEEDHWNEKLNYREIDYNNLAPGKYTFRVKAVNPNGYVTNEIRIPITISKPFWNTVGFYLLEIGLFGAIVFLSFLFTSRNSENRFGQVMTLVAVLIVFEALLLYISSYTDKYTNGIPVFQLVMNVLFAATLHPLENGIRKLMVRLAAKKKE